MILSISADFFGAPQISYEQINHLEKNSPNLILYALPLVAFFTLIEVLHSIYYARKNYRLNETLGSTLVGMGNVLINILLKISFLYATVWIYNLLPWRISLNWWTLIPCYIIFDFFSYWSHRISHHNRFFWATHVVHHSAEHFNLTVSFRMSWLQNLKIVFFIPVLLLGFHPIIFFLVSQISVLFQFWVHTEYIKKLHPAVEFLFATPSNHRVHHGSQEKYLDKNFAATFIVWDRMFGTFEPEDDVPEYGLTNKIGDRADPIFLNFHEIRDIITDVKKAKSFREKAFYLFGSPSKIAERKRMVNHKNSISPQTSIEN